jgi:hypothetical protein
MSIVESVWKSARELPLRDAAFHLWRYKHRLDDEEFERPKPVPIEVARDKVHMQTIMAQIRHEHDFAHEGPTFDRLKRAQPAARDEDIREAIKAALKMMDACEKYFDRDYTDFGRAIDHALAKAKRENPGFLHETWQHAGGWLVYVMK